MRREHIRIALSAALISVAVSGCSSFDALVSAEGTNPNARSTMSANAGSTQNRPGRTSLAGLRSGGRNGDRLAEVEDPSIFFETAAQVATQEHDYEAAVRHYANLAATEPQNLNYVVQLGRSLRSVGRHEDAERLLRQGLREHPQNFDLTEELGKSLLASGQLREGVAMLEPLADHPKVPGSRAANLHSAIGVAFDRAGDHKAAQAKYQTALRSDSLHTPTLNNMGLSFAMNGDLNSAERALRKALVSPQANAQVRQNLAMVLALKGRSKEAERLARQDLPQKLAQDVVGYYGDLSGQEGIFQNASAKASRNQLPQRVR